MDSPKKKCVFQVPEPDDILVPMGNTTSYASPVIREFLREADPSNPLERPCVGGKEDCLATQNLLNGKSDGLCLREFYVPSIWKKIVKLGKLPEKRTHCYYCQRYRSAVRYSLLTFEVDGNVFNRIHLNDNNNEDYE